MEKGIKYEGNKPRGIAYKHKKSYKDMYYIPFGKFILNRKLLNENILLVKYPNSHGPVVKIRRTPCTDTLKNLLNDLLDTGEINYTLQKALNEKEITLFELLLKLSGVTEQLNYKRQTKSVEDYVERFKILQGSIAAGNDSDEIKTELNDIIDLLSNKTVNRISLENAKMLKSYLN